MALHWSFLVFFSNGPPNGPPSGPPKGPPKGPLSGPPKRPPSGPPKGPPSRPPKGPLSGPPVWTTRWPNLMYNTSISLLYRQRDLPDVFFSLSIF